MVSSIVLLFLSLGHNIVFYKKKWERLGETEEVETMAKDLGRKRREKFGRSL